MVELATATGLGARAGWEFECIVLESDLDASRSPSPAMPANRCWSALTMASEEEELARLVDTLEAGAVPVDHVCAELGPGCLEIATAPEAAVAVGRLRCAGQALHQGVFRPRRPPGHLHGSAGVGVPRARRAPQPFATRADGDAAPLLCEEPGVLSKVGAWAVAGVITLLPELLAMAAPYPNSFRRFGPGNWAPSTATWGSDAYSCALRVVTREPASAAPRAADTRRRHEPASLFGHVPRRCPLGNRGATRPTAARHSLRLTDAPAGDRDLPHDLVEAAERFAASAAARELFGPAFVEHFAASRRVEAAACHRFVSAEERARYLAQV